MRKSAKNNKNYLLQAGADVLRALNTLRQFYNGCFCSPMTIVHEVNDMNYCIVGKGRINNMVWPSYGYLVKQDIHNLLAPFVAQKIVKKSKDKIGGYKLCVREEIVFSVLDNLEAECDN